MHLWHKLRFYFPVQNRKTQNAEESKSRVAFSVWIHLTSSHIGSFDIFLFQSEAYFTLSRNHSMASQVARLRLCYLTCCCCSVHSASFTIAIDAQWSINTTLPPSVRGYIQLMGIFQSIPKGFKDLILKSFKRAFRSSKMDISMQKVSHNPSLVIKRN